MSLTVAWLGLGLMGGPMAGHVARAGHTVRAWNRTPGRSGIDAARDGGAEVVADAEGAVAGADVVFTCVTDGEALAEVLSALDAETFAPGAVVVDTGTVGAEAARTSAAELAEAGVGFVDAPVTGGDVGARAGTLTSMLGGSEEHVARVRPLIDAYSRTVRHCGPVGAGQALKLCNQVLCGLHMVALTEALLLAKRSGLDPSLVVEVCSTGAAGSWALENLGPDVLAERFAPGFRAAHLLKDLRLALDVAEEDDGEPLQGLELAEELFETLVDVEEDEKAEWGTQALVRIYD